MQLHSVICIIPHWVTATLAFKQCASCKIWGFCDSLYTLWSLLGYIVMEEFSSILEEISSSIHPSCRFLSSVGSTFQYYILSQPGGLHIVCDAKIVTEQFSHLPPSGRVMSLFWLQSSVYKVCQYILHCWWQFTINFFNLCSVILSRCSVHSMWMYHVLQQLYIQMRTSFVT
jgi:hypothetical protein